MWLNPFFLTLGPAESRNGVVAVKTQLGFSLLYGCGHSAFSKKDVNSRPHAFCTFNEWHRLAVVRPVFGRRAMNECMEAEERLHAVHILTCSASLSF